MLFGAAHQGPAARRAGEFACAPKGLRPLRCEAGVCRGNDALQRVVFVDVRMPPGWDGFQTLERIFAADPAVPGPALYCAPPIPITAGASCARALAATDRLLMLRKPFGEAIEVAQLAFILSEKWHREQ